MKFATDRAEKRAVCFVFALPCLLYFSCGTPSSQETGEKVSDGSVVSSSAVRCGPGTYAGCGPRSLWVAARRSGIVVDLSEVEAACNMTTAGTSLYDLVVGADTLNLEPAAVRIGWEELIELGSPAVLFVGGNHFFCVDPREKPEDGNDERRVRVYDGQKAAMWMSRTELEDIWSGEAVIVGTLKKKAQPQGPMIEFETLLIDFGARGAGSVVVEDFVFRNAGTETLGIEGISKSCSCTGTEAEATQSTLAPGEEAAIRLRFNPANERHGFHSRSVYVATNDPHHRSIQLMLQGFVEKPLLLSRNLIDFGELAPGQEAQQKAIMTNRSASLPVFRTLEVVFDPASQGSQPENTGENNPLSAEVSCKRMGEGSEYEITIDMEASESASFGDYTGNLRFILDNREGPEPVLVVPVRVEVVRDLHALPEKVYFGIVQAGETVRREVELATRSGKPVELVDWRPRPFATADLPADEDPVPKINVVQNGRERAVAELVLSVPEDFSRTGLIKGRVELVSKHGESLGIDWLCAVKG